MSRSASVPIRRLWRVLFAGSLLVIAASGPHAATGESYSVKGDDVALYNLAGRVQLDPGPAGAVTVQVARGGRDAAQLKVQTGTLGSRQTLRVIYPGNHIVYRSMEHSSRSQMTVRDDGTFGDDGDRAGWGGHNVTISNSGGGLEAWADLTILVPRGQKLILRLGAGSVTATNLDGHILLETSSGPVVSRGSRGWLSVDTGSGTVSVKDSQGDVTVDTGSGDIDLTGARGGNVSLDTGSGRVSVTDARVDELKADTGSGEVDLNNIQSPSVSVDTGSGGVEVDLAGDIQSLTVDTGSGDVNLTVPRSLGAEFDLQSSSGNIEIGVPHEATHIESDRARGRIGDGRGQIKVDTGSGSVQIRPRTSSGASLDLGLGVFMNRTLE